MNQNNASKDCLIIFTRNPELGKGKRRLAADVGDEAALEIYKFLLEHTRSITKDLPVTKQVWYSEQVHQEDDWDNAVYEKYAQQGENLGARMHHAISEALKTHDTAIVIGSDLYDLSQKDLEFAFAKARKHNAVIGPAEDGGYYLLGFQKNIVGGIFEGKNWGSDSVLEATLADLQRVDFYQLEERNDVDYVEDIVDSPDFQPFLKDYHAK